MSESTTVLSNQVEQRNQFDMLSRLEIAQILGAPIMSVKKITDELLDNEDTAHLFTETDGILDCESEVLHKVSATLPAPEGWLSAEDISESSDCKEVDEIRSVLRQLRSERPIDIRPHINGGEKVETFAVPELKEHIVNLAKARIERRIVRDREVEIDDEFETTTEKFKSGDSLAADEFRKVVNLFGVDSTADILFHFNPDFKRIPVEKLRSFLRDYLGDYLITSSKLNFENLELSTEFLSSEPLRTAMTEVIKNDCLSTYQKAKRSNPGEDDFNIIADRLGELRKDAEEINNQMLNEILLEVEDYYLAVFTDIPIPSSLKDSLIANRPFPDLNQRINIKEIIDKRQMLIADDPGMGKSASAIIAKEAMGSKLAVITAPSSVINRGVWQEYLKDYFKEGQQPRVLVVDSPAKLRNVNADDYDYVLISHERLNDSYVESLKELNYDMLIADEAHKLKNLSEGKHAAKLVELADFLEGKEDTSTLMLTATPIPNKIGDIAMILRVLHPARFSKYDNNELINRILDGDILDIRSILVPRMQMKSLEDYIDIPPYEEEIVRLPIDQNEGPVYQLILEDDEIEASTKINVMRRLLQNPATLEVQPPIPSSKATYLNKKLKKVFKTSDKVSLVVNDYIDNIITGENTIFDQMDIPDDVQIRYIHGSIKPKERYKIQEEFQNSDEKILLVVNGQTADVGVDLSNADEVIFYNYGWTQSERRQQIGRYHRPGRTNALKITTLIAEGTIEEGIYQYSLAKERVNRKVLFGIPITDLEKELMKADDERSEKGLEVDPEFAQHYFSAMQRINRMFSYNKNTPGESHTKPFVKEFGEEYASTYLELSRRSHQANVARISGSVIETLIDSSEADQPKVLDLGSGPEMLRRHIRDDLADSVISLDLNPYHFVEASNASRMVGSFVNSPIASNSVDYVNMSLVLDTTKYLPSKHPKEPEALERLQVLNEVNRVLKKGGRAVISNIYSVEVTNPSEFNALIGRTGFRLVDEYSGQINSEHGSRGEIFTLEKVADSPNDLDTLVRKIGNRLMKGLKLRPAKVRPRQYRAIDRKVSIGDTSLEVTFNAKNHEIVDEETDLMATMSQLRQRYSGINNIPIAEIVRAGLIRATINNRPTLFSQLSTDYGAVYLRDRKG